MSWVPYAVVTVFCWGLYGAFLHSGAKNFENDRMKAFLFVGLAYVLIAVLAPIAVIVFRETQEAPRFEFKPDGIKWSLAAGVLGAVGALTVLFALNHHPLKGPAAASQVMSLVFAGAPMVAAIYGLLVNPPKDGYASLDWRFVAGLVLAATGGALVTLFKPST